MTLLEWLCLGFSTLFFGAMLVALIGFVARLFASDRPQARKRVKRG